MHKPYNAAQVLDLINDPPLDRLGIWDAGKDDYTKIPPRGWLLGNQFCRRFISSLLAAGGTGKTALRVAQLISLATGRSLTGEHVFQRCKVLIISLEDDKDELRRRVYAVLKHHGITPAEVEGWLFLATPKGLKLAEMRGGSPQASALVSLLRKAITDYKLDIISLDPFVKTHSLEENDNNAIDYVSDLLATIAIEYDCAVDTPHHTSKGTHSPGNADSGRGASSRVAADRLAYTLNTMTTDEAKTFSISDDDRHTFIRLDSAKVNITRHARKAKWFRIIGVPLGNGNERYPNGDEVQTVEPWEPPDLWADLSDSTLNRILDDIDAGMPDGRRYSGAPAAKTRAAWPIVQKHIPDRTEQQAREMISTWLKTGLLVGETYYDERDRKDRDGIRVDGAKRPGPR
jgi:AAA domain